MPEQEQEKTVRVKVVVARREGFPGYYAIQRFWPEGESEADIPEKQLAELKADKGPIGVTVLGGSSSKASDQNAPSSPITPENASPTGDLAASTVSEDTQKHAEKVSADEHKSTYGKHRR